MTPDYHNPSACQLGILCPDNHDPSLSDRCFIEIGERARLLIREGAPVPLVVFHLLTAAVVAGKGCDLDSGTLIRGLRVLLDMFAELDAEERTIPHD